MDYILIMRQRVSTLLILFVTITLLNVGLPVSEMVVAQPPNFVPYVNPSLGTAIGYPSDWLYLFNDYRTIFLPPDPNNLAVVAIDRPIDVTGVSWDTLLNKHMNISRGWITLL